MKNSQMPATHAREISNGERFSFGKNWTQFLETLDEPRVEQAIHSLKDMLEIDNLEGKSFLDIGSGSGLFSLAARRLGARVFSFDYDPQSVACTNELKRRYYESDSKWSIETGSVLDIDYLTSLGQFDIVYSWGVLHHTGDMWTALENVNSSVAPNGKLFIALYNNQGYVSKAWWRIKKTYVSLPHNLRWIVLFPCYIGLWLPIAIRDALILRPFNTWRTYKAKRGMSPHHDVIDWVGGFPFEVSKPEEIFDFYKSRGYRLSRMITTNRLGCNQFVFDKVAADIKASF